MRRTIFTHITLRLFVLLMACFIGVLHSVPAHSKSFLGISSPPVVHEHITFSFFSSEKDEYYQVASDLAETFNDEAVRVSRPDLPAVYEPVIDKAIVLFRAWVNEMYVPAAHPPQVYNSCPFYSRALNDFYRFLFRLTPF